MNAKEISKILFGSIYCFIHLLILLVHKHKSLILKDVDYWLEIRRHKMKPIAGFIYLMVTYQEFRNVFYFRIGNLKYLVKWYCPQRRNFTVAAGSIGEKFYVHLGYGTVIGAKSIGNNCMIYQGVTVGSLHGSPTILDNVKVFSGAIVMGDITIGNNVRIGANATVYKDVPDNTTVFPPESKSMKLPIPKQNSSEI